jgi:hypothetical protein
MQTNMEEIIHLHTPKKHSSHEELLLAIPGITFVVVMLAYIVVTNQVSQGAPAVAATTTQSSTLGAEDAP